MPNSAPFERAHSSILMMKEQRQGFIRMNSLTVGLETEWITHQGGIRQVTVGRFLLKITITSSQELWNADTAQPAWLDHWAYSVFKWVLSFYFTCVVDYKKGEYANLVVLSVFTVSRCAFHIFSLFFWLLQFKFTSGGFITADAPFFFFTSTSTLNVDTYPWLIMKRIHWCLYIRIHPSDNYVCKMFNYFFWIIVALSIFSITL